MPYKDKATRRAHYAANREKKNETERAHYAANRENEAGRMRQWRAANRTRAREIAAKGHAKWVAANREIYVFNTQRRAVAQRNIEFLLTFEEWKTIWYESGKWEQRGQHIDQYCMARFGDTGPYAVGNVRICTVRENCAEAVSLRPRRVHSEETRKRMSEAGKARWKRRREAHHDP